jgi:hypothetical protein
VVPGSSRCLCAAEGTETTVTGSSVAGIITAVATMLTALGGLLLALKVVVPIRKETSQIHTMVNQQRTDALNYQKALIRALSKAGVDIPEDQSATGEGESSDLRSRSADKRGRDGHA